MKFILVLLGVVSAASLVAYFHGGVTYPIEANPPISEGEAIELMNDFNASPLTGRSEEARRRMKAYLAWHQDNSSDPFAGSNAKHFEALERYWSVFENPKELDEDNGIYATADKLRPGEGDKLRAKELQTRFLALHFATPADLVRKELDRYMLAWESSQTETGPHDIDPLRWVIRNRPAILAERDMFHQNLDAIPQSQWNARLHVLTDWWREKADGAFILNADLARREAEKDNRQAGELERMRNEIYGGRQRDDDLRSYHDMEVERSLREIGRSLQFLDLKP